MGGTVTAGVPGFRRRALLPLMVGMLEELSVMVARLFLRLPGRTNADYRRTDSPRWCKRDHYYDEGNLQNSRH